MNKIIVSLLLAFALPGCADNTKDYDAQARCQALSLKPGTEQYNNCIREEKMQKMLRQQREEYEKSKQEDLDWKLRGSSRY